MVELIDGSKNYMNIVQQGIHLNLNSAICSFVTPPRRPLNNKGSNRRMSMPPDSHLKFHTPPSTKAPENLSKSLPKQGSVDRNSPSRLSPSQLYGKGFYAGAKFGERPLPTELPNPPNHWVSGNKQLESKEQSCMEMTNTLKVLLKVQS